MRSAPFGAAIVAALLWLAVGGFALLELWSMSPEEARGMLVFLAFAPPVFLLVHFSEVDDWERAGKYIANHPNRWVRLSLGLVFGVLILALCVGLWKWG